MLIKLIIIIVILAGAGELKAQRYQWPTNASRAITSTFSEFRPGHFHSGIDIKTWNREGYKIFAVNDGYISRIRVSPYGYGKVIYQKLSDGNTAVYAHLKGFSVALEKVIRSKQKESGNYRVDMYFKSRRFPVKRGDVIGVSGKTGTKYPHLHFEIRDSHNNPMNPLAFGFKVKDGVRPTPVKLAFIPLKSGSEIDGGFTEKVFKIIRVSRYFYEIADTVQIYGKIGLAISAYDMANNVSNKYGISSFRLKIDGVEYFRSNYETFSFNDTRQIEIDREYRLWRKGMGIFHSLYAKPYNTMPFYSYRSDGAINSLVMPGLHSFEIEIADYYGNKSTVRGAFVYKSADKLMYTLLNSGNDALTLKFSGAGIPLSRIELTGIAADKKSTKLGIRKRNKNESGISVTIPIKSIGYTHLKVAGHDMLGASLLPVIIKLKEVNKQNSVKIDFEYYDNHIVIQYKQSNIFDELPLLSLKTEYKKTVELKVNITSPYEFQSSIDIKLLRVPSTLRVVQRSSGEVIHSEYIFLNQISNEEGGTLVSKDGNFIAQFDDKSLYIDYFGDVELSDDAKYFSGSDEILTPVYNISPTYQPMKEVVKVLVRYPNSDMSKDKLGIYYHDSKKGWVYLISEHDSSMQVMSTEVLSLESFAVLGDNVPPTIKNVTPSNNSIIKSGKLEISARIKDLLSGIRDENDITIELDGEKKIFEWHPASNTVTYKSNRRLSRGKHSFTISAIDNAKNSASVTRIFTVN